jgi:hypothetical protein
MVDDSPSMAPKVSKMNAQFPKLIAALKNPNDGTLPDLRVAIIDSDLGTGSAYLSGSCGLRTLADGTVSPYGDMGRFQMLTSPTACTFNAGTQYLEYKSGAALNYTGDMGTVFGCLVGNVGTSGCGMEHQLQAFEFALAARGIGNETQQQMLRPDAYLGLVFLTDEDDCSAATNDGMFGTKTELQGETASLRCATRAHACGGRNLTPSPPGYPTDSAYSHPFNDCQARTDACPNQTDGNGSTDTSQPTDCSPLKDIHRLALELKGLKADPDHRIIVAGIFGWPLSDADMATAQYKIAPVPNPNTADTQHPAMYDYWPVCYDPNHMPAASTTDVKTGYDAVAVGWGATGGLRESAFVDEFGDNGLKFSICQPDFSTSMTAIGNAIARKLPIGANDGGPSDAPVVSSGTGGNGGAGGSTGAGGENCGMQTISASRQPADILLVLDRSGSMAYSTSADSNCATGATDCTGRWPALTSAVNATLSSMSGSINWGLKLFSSTGNACGVNSGVEVLITTTSVTAIQSVITSTQPGGNTPTAQAVQAAAAYLQTVKDQNTKYILLATDGEPNCAIGGNSTPNVQATVEAIAAATAAGFPVYVIGIGPSVGNLDNFAVAGGTTNYFSATSPQAMTDAFTSISNAVTTCTFNLAQASPDVNNVAVYLDKSLVAKDSANGWSLGANSTTIELNGSTCDKITSGAATQVQVLFGCPGTSPPLFIP